MKLASNYLLEIINQAFQVIIPIVTMPYVARVLGVELVGVSAYTFSIVSIFGVFALLGINVYGNRTIAAHRENRVTTNENFWAIFIIKLVSVLLTSAAYFIFIHKTGYTNKSILTLQSFNLLAVALDVSWLFIGHENFFKITVRNILVKTLSVIGIFTLVRTPGDLSKYVLLVPLSNIAGNLLLWPQMFKLLDCRPIFSFSVIKRHLSPMMSVFVAQAAIQVYVTFDKVLIGMIAGDRYVGVYDYAQKIARISMVLIGSLGTILLPRIANLWSTKQTEALNNHLQKSLNFSALIAFPIFLGLIAIAKPLTAILFPPEFSAVSTLLVILSPCILLWTINNITGFQILFPTKNEKYLTLSVIAGACFNAITNVFTVTRFGIVGAAITSTFTELFVTAIQVYFAQRVVRLSVNRRDLTKIICSSLLMFIIVSTIPYFFQSELLVLTVQLLSGFCTYIGFCWIFKIEVFEISFRLVSKK